MNLKNKILEILMKINQILKMSKMMRKLIADINLMKYITMRKNCIAMLNS